MADTNFELNLAQKTNNQGKENGVQIIIGFGLLKYYKTLSLK